VGVGLPSVALVDCSRGLSDFYPARLAVDQLSQAFDVEFWDGAVCGRRNGSVTKVTTAGSATQESLFVHTPTTDPDDDRLVVANGASPGVVTFYNHAYGATTPTINPADAFDFTLGVAWASLHGKLFIAAKSAVDRLHVYDGSHIRRTGLAAPAAPSVANTGFGSFAGARQYRVRFTVQSGGETVLRSEPSPVTAFTPSGSGLAARITKPADTGEGATHWEVEEIAATGSWYRIATVAVGTTTYDDSLAIADIPTNGVLSEDAGDYDLQYSARWLTVDEDRLILGGSHDDATLSARVAWTPIGAAGQDPASSSIGVGNDERLPADVGGFLDFDTLDGGGLTGLAAWEGKVIIFKLNQTHQMTRSQSRLRAYLPDTLSRRHGAIPNSIVEGTDVDGLSCLYFLDPDVGPMQLGFRGFRVLAPELQRTWKDQVNLDAAQVASVTYHPEKRQVWWHVAIGAATKPSRRWMYSVESDGVVYQTIPAPVRAAQPWNGKPHCLIDGAGAGTPIIYQADDPSTVTDYTGATFRAYIRSKAFQLAGVLTRFNIASGLIEAGALAATSVAVYLIRDWGLETRGPFTASIAPAGAEPFVIRPLDSCYVSDAVTIEIEIGDPVAGSGAGAWQIHGAHFTTAPASPSTGRKA
jgi:hypothetical protein